MDEKIVTELVESKIDLAPPGTAGVKIKYILVQIDPELQGEKSW